jgi:hypothetical protein
LGCWDFQKVAPITGESKLDWDLADLVFRYHRVFPRNGGCILLSLWGTEPELSSQERQ